MKIRQWFVCGIVTFLSSGGVIVQAGEHDVAAIVAKQEIEYLQRWYAYQRCRYSISCLATIAATSCSPACTMTPPLDKKVTIPHTNHCLIFILFPSIWRIVKR